LTATIKAPADPASQAFDPKDFRRACGQFATGITVVTVRDGDGVRGMTANSFTSVSLDPPLVLVSVDLRNRTHQLIEESGRFAVNVLSQQHRDWSDRFAGRHGDLQGQFDDVPHRLTDCGLPLFEGALASFVCRLFQAYRPAITPCSSARSSGWSARRAPSRCCSTAAGTAGWTHRPAPERRRPALIWKVPSLAAGRGSEAEFKQAGHGRV
jgi:flavin reductase (DIM6/NTAB) family NADH-FMN oxidoreductase RutF